MGVTPPCMDEPIRSLVCMHIFYLVPTKRNKFVALFRFFSVTVATIPPKSNGKLQLEAAKAVKRAN